MENNKDLGASRIEFTRINNDVNGNPRYVCHYLNLIRDKDFEIATQDMTDEEKPVYFSGIKRTEYGYKLACKRANKIGGKKFHNKQYGGGIVFQSYSLPDLEKSINELVNS